MYGELIVTLLCGFLHRDFRKNIKAMDYRYIFTMYMLEDETHCQYVGSRGILKSCIFRSCIPCSSVHIVLTNDYTDFVHLKHGDTIYICSSAINDFVYTVLPKIKKRFILVSGDSDTLIPYGALSEEGFNTLIHNKYLIVWFSQNLAISPKIIPKLQYLPIGLDYHTMTTREMEWGARASPLMQERLLLSAASKAPPLLSRKPIAYTTFHFELNRGGRMEAYKQIPKELVYYEPSRVKRVVSWKRQTEYAFVVSPPGEGLDCHRTWEALCLGCIPILLTSSLDDMFSDLPVLIVKSWTDVTRELLNSTIEEYSTRDFCKEKLTLKYWMNKINSYKNLA